jgi:hypothetical protein
VGNVLSSDVFYNDDRTAEQRWAKMGVLAVEMESAALYLNAMRARRRALTILTVTDVVSRGEALTAEERQESLTQMMEVALSLATPDPECSRGNTRESLPLQIGSFGSMGCLVRERTGRRKGTEMPDQSSFTRRGFLKGLAGACALGATGALVGCGGSSSDSSSSSDTSSSYRRVRDHAQGRDGHRYRWR